jgi:hypothetical protein
VGTGCAPLDLCSPGWRLCTVNEVLAKGCTSALNGLPAGASAFFTQATSGPGGGLCDGGGTNDLFGCGTLGAPPPAATCPLPTFSGDQGGSLLPPWAFPLTNGFDEAVVVIKPGSDGGGVLCCQ